MLKMELVWSIPPNCLPPKMVRLICRSVIHCGHGLYRSLPERFTIRAAPKTVLVEFAGSYVLRLSTGTRGFTLRLKPNLLSLEWCLSRVPVIKTKCGTKVSQQQLQWVMSKLFSLGGSTTDSVPEGRSGEAGGALSSIADERMVGSGRDQAHSMRQITSTKMECVTWRYVPRGTCHVPPREPLRKQALGKNFRIGGRRDPKLEGYMRPGMAHVPCK